MNQLVKQVTDLPDMSPTGRQPLDDPRRAVAGTAGHTASDASRCWAGPHRGRFTFRSNGISGRVASATVPRGQFALRHFTWSPTSRSSNFFTATCSARRRRPLRRRARPGDADTFASWWDRRAVTALPGSFSSSGSVAAVDIARAHQRQRLYGSMLDPELVLAGDEVEGGLFAASSARALADRGGRRHQRRRRAQQPVRPALRCPRGFAPPWGTWFTRSPGRSSRPRPMTSTGLPHRDPARRGPRRVVQKLIEPVLAYVESEACSRCGQRPRGNPVRVFICSTRGPVARARAAGAVVGRDRARRSHAGSFLDAAAVHAAADADRGSQLHADHRRRHEPGDIFAAAAGPPHPPHHRRHTSTCT